VCQDSVRLAEVDSSGQSAKMRFSEDGGDEYMSTQSAKLTYHAITDQVRRRIEPDALGEKEIVFRRPLLSDVLIRHLLDLCML
jgi:hypothetical protein